MGDALPLTVGLLQAARLALEVGDALVSRGKGTGQPTGLRVGQSLAEPAGELLLEGRRSDDLGGPQEHAVAAWGGLDEVTDLELESAASGRGNGDLVVEVSRYLNIRPASITGHLRALRRAD
jgi:hypothetical protein